MNRYNSEGYPDPTAAMALAHVAQNERANGTKPCVFVCSPFAGNIPKNTQNARRYMKYAVDKGVIPFAPHLLYPMVLDEHDPVQRKLGLSFGLVWLSMCDELWVFGDHISSGMQLEIEKARACHIPIRYFSENCKEVVNK